MENFKLIGEDFLLDESKQDLVATVVGVSTLTGIACPTIKKHAKNGALGQKLPSNVLQSQSVHRSKKEGYWFNINDINKLLSLKTKIKKTEQLQKIRTTLAEYALHSILKVDLIEKDDGKCLKLFRCGESPASPIKEDDSRLLSNEDRKWLEAKEKLKSGWNANSFGDIPLLVAERFGVDVSKLSELKNPANTVALIDQAHHKYTNISTEAPQSESPNEAEYEDSINSEEEDEEEDSEEDSEGKDDIDSEMDYE